LAAARQVAWLVGRVTGQEFAKGRPYPPSTKETRALLVDDRRQRFLGGADRELKAAVSMGYARGKFEPRDEIQRLATSGTPS
jgi:hypothetical protein